VGRIAHPEQLEPGDVIRSTASLHYTRPLPGGESWSSSFIWGRNHETYTRRNLNSFLAESVLPVPGKNFLTGRSELVDKDELFSDNPELEAQIDRTAGSTFRIGAYTAGLTHDLPSLIHGVETGIGANVTTYSLPAATIGFCRLSVLALSRSTTDHRRRRPIPGLSHLPCPNLPNLPLNSRRNWHKI